MADFDADVIIIGAGAAGLAAANRLTIAGRRTLVIEARDRTGGRIDTRFDDTWPAPIERGAEFVHGRPAETFDIVRAAGLAIGEVVGSQWHRIDGRLEPSRRWDEMQKVLDRLEQLDDQDMSFADFLKSHAADASDEAKRSLRQYIQGFEAADPNLISALALRDSERASEVIQADENFRLPGGYCKLLDWLHTSADRSRLEILLRTIVARIVWQPGRVEIESTGGEQFAAPKSLVTLPLGVLQTAAGSPGSVEFSPPLDQKRAALGKLKMGPVVKLVLQFDEPFWEREKFADMSFLFLPDEKFPTWWTQLPRHLPILTGWAGGPLADRLAPLSDDQILAEGIAAIARGFGIERTHIERRLRGWHVANWPADPLSRGAYSYVTVGGANALSELAEPIADTLFFAGEATEPGFGGTVASALKSGYRAADEILES